MRRRNVPQHRLLTPLGGQISLQGYDVQPANLQRGQPLYLQLHWLVASTLRNDWTVFAPLLAQDTAGHKRLVADYDSRPGNRSLPTTRWQAGWRLVDEYQLQLSKALTLGTDQLEVGLYTSTGEQLPRTGSGLALGVVMIK